MNERTTSLQPDIMNPRDGKKGFVRQARAADAAEIVRLIGELAASSGETSGATREYVAEYLSSTGSHVLLYERDGTVLGALTYSVRPNLFHAGDSVSAPVVR
ncbi:MAG: hypothetical protein ACM3X4_00850 [Ignavibacteriales bacterium]